MQEQMTTPRCIPQKRALLLLSSRRRHLVLAARQRQEKLRQKRRARRIEYQRLRVMVPSIAAKPLVSKVTVIEEAIRYIDYLHGALLTRLRTKGLPSCLQDAPVDMNSLSLEDIKALVCRLVQRGEGLPREGPPSAPLLQRSRSRPSYLSARRPFRRRPS